MFLPSCTRLSGHSRHSYRYTGTRHTKQRTSPVPTSRGRRPHLLHDISLRLHITNLSTLPTLPRFTIRLKLLHRLLYLRPQIRAVETLLVHLTPTTLTKPHQTIQTPLRPRLLDHHANRIRETHGVVRDVSREQEQLALVDVDVFELVCSGLDGFEQHAAFELVEELGGRVEVVVCARVGTSYDHYCHGVVVD